MEIISTNVLISINATFIAQLISFLIFIFMLNKILISPLRKTSFKRDEYLKNIQKEISYSKNQLDTFLTRLENEKIEVINKSFSLVKDMENKGTLKAKNIYNKAKEEIYSFQKKADKEIEKQINVLNTSLYKDVNKITTLVIEKILDRSSIK